MEEWRIGLIQLPTRNPKSKIQNPIAQSPFALAPGLMLLFPVTVAGLLARRRRLAIAVALALLLIVLIGVGTAFAAVEVGLMEEWKNGRLEEWKIGRPALTTKGSVEGLEEWPGTSANNALRTTPYAPRPDHAYQSLISNLQPTGQASPTSTGPLTTTYTYDPLYRLTGASSISNLQLPIHLRRGRQPPDLPDQRHASRDLHLQHRQPPDRSQ